MKDWLHFIGGEYSEGVETIKADLRYAFREASLQAKITGCRLAAAGELALGAGFSCASGVGFVDWAHKDQPVMGAIAVGALTMAIGSGLAAAKSIQKANGFSDQYKEKYGTESAPEHLELRPLERGEDQFVPDQYIEFVKRNQTLVYEEHAPLNSF
ncbi:MAG: hypothetical protein K9G62_04120 [Alphaproteobacteria bacterium]|nr:hypothetical protein [Alphaproteobacteria bacterium]